MKKIFIILFLIVCSTINFSSLAQVNSSGLSGHVYEGKNKALAGAIIKATHMPSGSVYGAASQADGSFTIQNMRVGGPYKVEVSYTGFETRKYDSINLELGEQFLLNIDLQASANELNNVVIASKRDNLYNNQNSGASTLISVEQIENIPSISRSIGDLVKLTPQSSGGSIMGQDNHYNNYQINGANFNNTFGLSAGLPGITQPFSIESIEQISVGVSAFDISQTNFTGGNINMVTKSGTNELKGTVYDYWRNQTYNGKYVGHDTLPPQTKNVNNIYGFGIGGPLIKNKLFFYANVELEKNTYPGISPNWIASGPGVTGTNISTTPAADLTKFSHFLDSAYGYKTGPYQNYANNFSTSSKRYAVRLDYNFNQNNKFDLSINQYNGSKDQLLNSRSAANGSVANSRIGAGSLSFANSDYALTSNLTSVAAEWVHKINDHASNQLLASYTHVQDTRSSPSSQFPFIDIYNGTTNYMSAGYELFSYKNDVKQNSFNVYNNVTITKNKHFITAGISYQDFFVYNSYLPYGTTYYRYNTLNDFITSQPAAGFGYTYPYDNQDGYAKVHYGLGSVYGQDKINVRKNLVVTAGLRIEVPFYLNKLTPNDSVSKLNFLNPAGDTTHYSVNNWPKSKPTVSPRVSFNWTPSEKIKLRVRGGTGVFVGQVPFVWITNQVANSGTTTNNVQVTNGTVLNYLKFQPDPSKALLNLPDSLKKIWFPSKAGSAAPGLIAAIDPNFKMPAVWRTDVSGDYKLPFFDLVATADLIYSKTLVGVKQFNANLPKPSGTMVDSAANILDHQIHDNRPYYMSSRINPGVSGAYILTNSNKGESYSATIGIARAPHNGVFGSFHYTRMYATDIAGNLGSQAGSAWLNIPHIASPNDVVASPSDYFVPNRFIGTLSYRQEYIKHAATTVTLVYEGYSGGRFSYEYYNGVNFIGNSDNIYYDLIYIPKSASDIKFIDITNTSGKTLFTAAQEQAAFATFMAQDKYLNSHRGQYAQRNGASYPFYSKLDARFLQDIFAATYKKRKTTLQFSLDIINLANLINKEWGISKTVVDGGEIMTAVNGGKTGSQIVGYKLVTYNDKNGVAQLPTQTFINSVSTGSVWNMQMGLRLIF